MKNTGIFGKMDVRVLCATHMSILRRFMKGCE
jgi:hypothetical protein